jgi:uncharacterized membrane protein YhaH (DUF805 family)
MKQYFTWQGRMNRSKFFILFFILGFLNNVIIRFLNHLITLSPIVGYALYYVFMIVFFYVLICGLFQRLHDCNKPGWLSPIYLIPFLLFSLVDRRQGSVFLLLLSIALLAPTLYLYFKKGTSGPNKYGPDPLVRGFIQTEEKASDQSLEITE